MTRGVFVYAGLLCEITAGAFFYTGLFLIVRYGQRPEHRRRAMIGYANAAVGILFVLLGIVLPSR